MPFFAHLDDAFEEGMRDFRANSFESRMPSYRAPVEADELPLWTRSGEELTPLYLRVSPRIPAQQLIQTPVDRMSEIVKGSFHHLRSAQTGYFLKALRRAAMRESSHPTIELAYREMHDPRYLPGFTLDEEDQTPSYLFLHPRTFIELRVATECGFDPQRLWNGLKLNGIAIELHTEVPENEALLWAVSIPPLKEDRNLEVHGIVVVDQPLTVETGMSKIGFLPHELYAEMREDIRFGFNERFVQRITFTRPMR